MCGLLLLLGLWSVGLGMLLGLALVLGICLFDNPPGEGNGPRWGDPRRRDRC